MSLTANGLSGYVTVGLAPGSTDSQDVLALQNWLVKNSFLTQAQLNTGPGTYGPATTAAVASLQQQLGIDAGSFPGYYGTLTIATIQAEIDALTPNFTPNPDQLGSILIEQFEGFRSTAYFDVNHYRVGYGNDLYAVSNGSGGWIYDLNVTQSTTTSMDAAAAELLHRLDTNLNGGIPGIERDLGSSKFLSLSPLRQAVLESIAWNYGSFQSAALATIVADFNNNSPYDKIANDIQALTVNPSRRADEAKLFRWENSTTGGGNHAPVANNDSYSTNFNTALTIAASGVLANDTDQDGNSLTVSSASNPGHGTLQAFSNGSFTYTPHSGYSGPDSFTYFASDGIANSATAATVSITVRTSTSDLAGNTTATALELGGLSPGAHVTKTDTVGPSDPDDFFRFELTQSETVTMRLDGINAGGQANVFLLRSDGTTIVSDQNFFDGTIVQTLGAGTYYADVKGETLFHSDTPYTLTINTSGTTNHAPVANNDSYSTAFNTALTVAATAGVLANDTDQDGNSLTVALVSNPSHGTLHTFSDGSFTYTPNSGYSGPDSFSYFASDGTVNSASAATVSITVGGPANHAPVANNDSYSTDFNTALTIAASGVLANDTDQDGNSLTVASVSNPGHGTLQAFANGSFTYTPNSGYSGADSFTYFVSDGTTNSASAATVSITVGGPIDHAPVANNDSYSTSFNTALTIAASGVLANDTDQDGNSLTVSSVSNPGHGTLQAFANGSFAYTPNSGYSGPDSFTYFANDGTLNSASAATVSITVGAPIFPQPTFELAGFAPNAGGWASDNTYPRELADVNGDGMADIVGFGDAGVWVSLATGGGAFGNASLRTTGFAVGAGGWSSDDKFPRELADVNGDGMADIVGFGDAGVWVSLATGGGSFGAASLRTTGFAVGAGGWSSDNKYPRELADVNGDHMADIVGFGDAGVWVSLATGGGSFGNASLRTTGFAVGAGGWSSNDKFPRELADVNGDGMADIVGFGDAGVWVSLATGGGSFGAASLKTAGFAFGAGGWTSDNTYPRELADVNHDGMADIVGFGEAGVWVALATGGGSFGAASLQLGNFAHGAGGWTSADQYPRHLADVNHDGAADIIGFGQIGVYESLSNGFHLI
jgi:hypothetical protein